MDSVQVIVSSVLLLKHHMQAYDGELVLVAKRLLHRLPHSAHLQLSPP